MDVDSQLRLTNALIGQRVPELIRLRLRFAPAASDGAAVIAGDTALVTRLHHPGGQYVALRVANDRTVGRDWPRHYSALAEDIPEPAAAFFPSRIAVIEGGITIAGAKMPAVLMEWIDGLTVFDAADKAAAESNRPVLLALAESLIEFSTALRDARVTHGDLSPDNLMMRSNGDIVCVDLDTVQWPGMRVRSLQAGSPAYRHPRPGAIPRHQDAHALLVLYTSLHVLADAPELRDAVGHDVEVHGGGLLFSSWDLAEPSTSRAFALARERVGARSRQLLELLERAGASEPYRTPDFLAEAFALPPEKERPASIDAADSPDGWNLSRVIDRLRSEFGDDDGTRRAADDRAFVETWPRIDDDPEPVSVSRPSIEPTTPDSPSFATLEQEEAWAEQARERIMEAARRQDDETIVRIARDAEVRGLPLGAETRRVARLASERRAVRDRLERAMATNDRPALAGLARSGELVVLGDTDRKSLTRVLQALEWPGLVRALESDDDALILSWYDDELFGDAAAAADADALPADLRARVELAQVRTAWVADIRAMLKRRDSRQMEALLAREPQNGLEKLSRGERARVLRLIERQAALDSLHAALRDGDSVRILQALNAIERAGARIENPATWAAVQGVLERATVIEQIVDAATASPPDDRQLAHLLPVAKRLGLTHDPAFRGELSFQKLEAMVLRGAAVRRIRRAIEQDDDHAIRQAAYPDVTGALELLTQDELERIETAQSSRIVARVVSQ